MKPTFSNTIDILVKAYLNDTLKHGNCRACAVGNILKSAEWMRLFFTDTIFPPPKQLLVPDENYCVSETDDGMEYTVRPVSEVPAFRASAHRYAIQLVNESGYTIHELARVEYAFETANFGDSEDQWMFNGLMAVVEVLADIHGVSLEQKQEAISLFKKAIPS